MFRRIFSGLLCVLSVAIVSSAVSGSQAEQKVPPMVSQKPMVRHVALKDQRLNLEMAAALADQHSAGTLMAIAALANMHQRPVAVATRP
ncbi:MAG TPA: hypothetical protein VFA18_24510 [Gemmataceae bacterium]|nr:hypothetical protein [Gemmataceae bacterium]